MPKLVHVKVVPRAKQRKIKNESGVLKVFTPAPAVDGKANTSVIEQLAEFFGVKKRQVVIVRGGQSRQKVVEILE